MISEPNLNKEQLKNLLENKYALQIEDLIFEPKGEVSWSYIIQCKDGEKKFIKIHKRRDLNIQRLQLLFDLHTKCQIENIAYPLKTIEGDLEIEVDGYPAVLFNFINGKTSLEQELTNDQLMNLGELLARIHQSKVAVGSFDTKEKFTHSFKPGIQNIYDYLDKPQELNEPQKETVEIYRRFREIFLAELDSLEKLGVDFRNRDIEFVNCHGEPSPNNILITPKGQVYLIDWDEPIFAPKEKDLMFFDKRFQQFMKGYGKSSKDIALNKDVLKYYQLLWNVQEIEDWGTRVLFEEHLLNEYQYYLDQLKHFLDYSGLKKRFQNYKSIS